MTEQVTNDVKERQDIESLPIPDASSKYSSSISIAKYSDAYTTPDNQVTVADEEWKNVDSKMVAPLVSPVITTRVEVRHLGTNTYAINDGMFLDIIIQSRVMMPQQTHAGKPAQPFESPQERAYYRKQPRGRRSTQGSDNGLNVSTSPKFSFEDVTLGRDSVPSSLGVLVRLPEVERNRKNLSRLNKNRAEVAKDQSINATLAELCCISGNRRDSSPCYLPRITKSKR